MNAYKIARTELTSPVFKMKTTVFAVLFASVLLVAAYAQQQCGQMTCTAQQCCIQNTVCRPLRRQGQYCTTRNNARICGCAQGLNCRTRRNRNWGRCRNSSSTARPGRRTTTTTVAA